jgi:phosphoserine phosphatase
MTNISRLQRWGWHPEVYQRLQALFEEYGRPGATPDSTSPVVVFDFDNTCIINDIGELFSHYLIDEMLYRYERDDFWQLIHPDDGREDLLEMARVLVALAEDHRRQHPLYSRYLADMGALYGRRLARAGKADCYEWAVRLHVGMRPDEVRSLARKAIRRELARPLETESRNSSCGLTTNISRGVRVVREMRELIDALSGHGIEAWIVSASNVWAVEAFATLFDVPAQRVIGNSLIEDHHGVLTSETVRPVLFRQGKVDAIERHVRRRPIAAFGDAETDLEMLQWATDLAVVIDRGCEVLRREAQRKSWPMQPQSEFHPEALDADIERLKEA